MNLSKSFTAFCDSIPAADGPLTSEACTSRLQQQLRLNAPLTEIPTLALVCRILCEQQSHDSRERRKAVTLLLQTISADLEVTCTELSRQAEIRQALFIFTQHRADMRAVISKATHADVLLVSSLNIAIIKPYSCTIKRQADVWIVTATGACANSRMDCHQRYTWRAKLPQLQNMPAAAANMQSARRSLSCSCTSFVIPCGYKRYAAMQPSVCSANN